MEEESRSSSSDDEERSSSSSDLISSLPDELIHHILSFLPSTKQAIRTGTLSKRWRYQWTRVPILIFKVSFMSSGMQCRVIDETLALHDCPKIKTFHLESNFYLEYNFTEDPVSFAVRKGVQELILDMGYLENFKLPNLVFNLPSLVRLHIKNCTLMPDDGRIKWKHLKVLYVEYCCWSNQAIESVVSGSPLLESLEITFCFGFDQLVIASKSLTKLVLRDHYESFGLQVSCPNLVEFYAMTGYRAEQFELSHGAIENLLSASPSLERLELIECKLLGAQQLVMDLKSLRKLVLAGTKTPAIVISCPNLEELHLYRLEFKTIKLKNLPCSVCVTVECDWHSKDDCEILGKMILKQLHDVKELNIGRYFLTTLSTLEIKGKPSPSINVKCMTFDGGPNFVENLPGIAYGLRISPELEELVIISRQSQCPIHMSWILEDEWLPDDVSVENYWKSNGTDFNCLESHLKIVKIFVFSKNSGNLNLVFNFLEFLLKNAKVLEKMIVVLEHHEADFVFEVSQKMLSFPRYSRHAIVELLCSEWPRTFMHGYHR